MTSLTMIGPRSRCWSAGSVMASLLCLAACTSSEKPSGSESSGAGGSTSGVGSGGIPGSGGARGGTGGVAGNGTGGARKSDAGTSGGSGGDTGDAGASAGSDAGDAGSNAITTFANTYDGARATTESLDSAWKFHLGDASGADAATFEDASWTALDVPHDWSISLAFNQSSAAG